MATKKKATKTHTQQRGARRNMKLEDAILADLDDPKAWLVYGDWLQDEGDPRGELVTIQTSAEGKRKKKLLERVDEIMKEHGDALLGDLRRHSQTLDGKKAETFTWKRGFLHSIRISYNVHAHNRCGAKPVDVPAFLSEILAHPSAAFVEQIVIGQFDGGVWDKKRQSSQVYQPLIDCIAKAKPRALRRLVIGDFEFPNETEISWTCIGSLEKIWKACPRLETLSVQGGKIDFGTTIDAPRLRSFTVRTGGLPKKAVTAIAKSKWPMLEFLEIWFGDGQYGAGGTIDDIQPILDGGANLPKLKHLGLKNSEFADALAHAIGQSKIVRQLDHLDLSMGVMTDDGANALVASAKALKNLAKLDVSNNCIDDAKLKGIAKHVIVGNQKDLDRRYVSVGE